MRVAKCLWCEPRRKERERERERERENLAFGPVSPNHCWLAIISSLLKVGFFMPDPQCSFVNWSPPTFLPGEDDTDGSLG